MASLEAQLESAVDAKTKAELSFELCYHHIRKGEFNRAESLIDDLKPELRRPIANIMELKRTTMAFESDSLGDAASKIASLKDSLHQVLASLSLASAYWTRSEKTPESLEDREATDRALQIAMSSTESVPDFLRPNARTAVASLLAKCGHHEDALRMLELAVQELNTDRPHEEGEEPAAVVRYHDSGHFAAVITDGERTLYFDLVPLNLRGLNFDQAIVNLSLVPEMDLERLEAVASNPVDLELRIRGLVAFASTVLTRSFKTAPPQ